MVRTTSAGVQYAPLFIVSLPYVQPHKLLEAETMNIVHPDPLDLKNIPDRLRWYRHQKGLMQKDVAKLAKLDRTTYSGYEEMGVRDYYPLDKLTRIAAVLDAPIEALLDEYNGFLYRGQGEQIKAMMERKGLSQQGLAQSLGVWTSTVNDWVNDRVRVTKATWEKLIGAEE